MTLYQRHISSLCILFSGIYFFFFRLVSNFCIVHCNRLTNGLATCYTQRYERATKSSYRLLVYLPDGHCWHLNFSMLRATYIFTCLFSTLPLLEQCEFHQFQILVTFPAISAALPLTLTLTRTSSDAFYCFAHPKHRCNLDVDFFLPLLFSASMHSFAALTKRKILLPAFRDVHPSRKPPARCFER